MSGAVLRGLGLVFLVATLPLIWWALARLGSLDYVGGGLGVLAVAAFGQAGLELVALSHPRPASGPPPEDG